MVLTLAYHLVERLKKEANGNVQSIIGYLTLKVETTQSCLDKDVFSVALKGLLITYPQFAPQKV